MAEEQQELTPQQIHDILLTSMVKALSTADKELVAFAQGRYQQFWSENMIVPRPPAEEPQAPEQTVTVEEDPPNGKPKKKIPAKTR